MGSRCCKKDFGQKSDLELGLCSQNKVPLSIPKFLFCFGSFFWREVRNSILGPVLGSVLRSVLEPVLSPKKCC